MSLITLLSVSVGAGILARAQDSAGTFTYDVLDDGTVMLTGYTGTASDVTVPATIDGYTVYGLGSGAMENNDAIETVTFESGVQYIGLTALGYCDQLESVVLSDTINKVEANAFSYSPNLERILVDSQNTVYDSRNDCNGLIETATNTFIAGGSRSAIPEGIVRIEGDAFNGCASLTEIDIPNTVQTIGTFAFHETGLTSVTIPASVTKLEMSGYGGYYYPFYECLSLEASYVDPANPRYASLDGVLFSKDMTNIYRYPQGKKDTVYVLPATVTRVEGEGNGYSYPFFENPYLQHIVFPESVEYIARCTATTNLENAGITVLNPNCYLADFETNGEACFYGFPGSSIEIQEGSFYKDMFVKLSAPSGQGIVPEQTDSTYTVSSDRPATIYCTYALDDLLNVTVDYVPVPAENYTLASGSTVLQLHPDFLNTLSPGEHVVSLNYKNATASAVLTIESEDEPSAPPEDTTVPDKPAGPSEPAAPDGTTAPVQNTEVTEEPEPSFAQSQQSGVQKSPATGAGSIYIALAVSGAAMAGILVLCRKKKAGAC